MDEHTTHYLAQFGLLMVAHTLAVMSPGADLAVVISQSVRYGRRIGIYTAIGIGCGIGVHVLYTLFGIGVLLSTNASAMTVAKLLGAAYLFWLGVALLRAKSSKPANTATTDNTASTQAGKHTTPVSQRASQPRGAFLRGFFTNATNPKVTLFFLAIFTTIVAANTPMYIQALYGIWLCLSTALWFSFVATMLTKPRVQQLFLRLGHWFERVMGVVLITFAIRLLLSELG